MRFIVYGAGAVGGTVGGRLFQAGHDVALVARGAHRDAIASNGLTLATPDETVDLAIGVAGHPSELDLTDDDVVLLAMKSHDTAAALDALGTHAPPGIAIVCLQNGVANEREALRHFASVYAVPVMLPAAHLEPGVVESYSTPVTGILDIGRYPSGVDERARAIAAAFAASTFASEARHDVLRWKWSKLLLNLGNAIEALCSDGDPGGRLYSLARDEAEAALAAAGIDFASYDEDRDRRGDLLRMHPIDGRRRGGGSSWQSLARGLGSIETDYLNGEIVLLGRLHGVPTPANAVLQRAAADAARRRLPPGSVTNDELLALVEAER